MIAIQTVRTATPAPLTVPAGRRDRAGVAMPGTAAVARSARTAATKTGPPRGAPR